MKEDEPIPPTTLQVHPAGSTAEQAIAGADPWGAEIDAQMLKASPPSQ